MPLCFNLSRKEKKKSKKTVVNPWDACPEHPPYLDPDRISINAVPIDLEAAGLFDQDQSLFCRLLPREIRVLIFEHVIGNHVIHLDFERHVKTDPCPTNPSPSRWREKAPSPTYVHGMRWWHGMCVGDMRYWYNDYCNFMRFWEPTTEWAYQRIEVDEWVKVSLALLTVCKKLYSEACFVLYSRNIFDFVKPKSITHLSRLWTSTQLQSLRSINTRWYMADKDYPHRGVSRSALSSTYLEMTDKAYLEYDKFWKALAELPGLSVLRVALNTVPITDLVSEINEGSQETGFPKERMRAAWLGPIDKFKDKHLSKFELALGASWVEVLWGRELTEVNDSLEITKHGYVAPPVAISDKPFVLIVFNDKMMVSNASMSYCVLRDPTAHGGAL